MTQRRNAKLLQVLVRQTRKNRLVDVVLADTASYCPRPRLRSQTTMSMMAPELRLAAYHRWRVAENMAPSLMPVLGDPSLAGEEGGRNRLDLS